ncbi:MAG: HAMP domain-containing histidine kinase [Phycisphaerales bacterium]|nr:HAMP domain-containing histidine kinase [Phycisphaerales bacterium]
MEHSPQSAGGPGSVRALAHDLRNILAPAQTLADLALRSPGDTALAERALRRTIESIQKADAILAHALPGAAGRGPQAPAADVHASVANALETIAPEADRLGWTVSPLAASAAGPVLCAMRAEDLERVLVNLLLNAGEATRLAGGANPTVRVDLEVQPGVVVRRSGKAVNHSNTKHSTINSLAGSITLTIRDQGVGMTPAQVRAALGRARPLSGWAARGGRKGSGVGLTVVRQLVEEAGGELSITSARGRGSQVRVRLPLAA